MQYFNIELYKDWETDPAWSQTEDEKFLKKDNERLSLSYYDDKIQVERSSILNTYKKTAVYDKKTSLMRIFLTQFYQFSIGITKTYDETGLLINEVNNDKPYLFTLPQLIEKIKNENGADLEDRTQKSIVSRHVDQEIGKPIYEVYLRSKEYPDAKWEYFLIDGITGETLFITSYPTRSAKPKVPIYEYLKVLKQKKAEDNAYYKSYKGKHYTKKEWEIFEEEWHRKDEEQKNGRNFFWDNIFNK
ncbi:hypothetical protein SAMN06265346_103216 [Flavobacterium hercynium]|nr:hypothetical protein SAMN06265346_103216 [Flavobacterium hercynium]